MKDLNKNNIVYALIIIGCLISVPLRIQQVKHERTRKIVTLYDEWKNSGKPVEVKTVEAQDVPVYAQFTVRTTDGQVAHGYVTGEVKDALKPGQEVYNEDKSAVCAKLLSVSREMDINTGMFPVEVEFINPVEPEKLFVVCCHTATLRDSLALPNEVLDIVNGEYFVWKEENGLAKKYKVKIGTRNGYGAIITEGLRSGDKVIMSGQSLLADNDRLLVINAGEIDKEGKAR